MAAAIKNHVVGPATLSIGGVDVGGIKKGTLEMNVEQDVTMIGDNEQYSGTVAVYRRISRIYFKATLQEVSLTNFKLALGLSATVAGTNPQTLNLDFETGILSSVAIIVTCAAPRTTAGVAQTRTITSTAGAPTIKNFKYKPGVDAVNEMDVEFDVLYSDGSGDLVISDENA